MDSILVPPLNSSPHGTAHSATKATADSRLPVVAWLQRLLLPPVVRVRLMLLTGFLGALIVVVTAPVRREAAPSWRSTLPFVPHPGHALFSAGSFIVGMTMLSLAWIRLGAFTTDRSQTSSPAPSHRARGGRVVDRTDPARPAVAVQRRLQLRRAGRARQPRRRPDGRRSQRARRRSVHARGRRDLVEQPRAVRSRMEQDRRDGRRCH